jgi:hypothetical protein
MPSPLHDESTIDETIDASFPASDPPSWTLGLESYHGAPVWHRASATIEVNPEGKTPLSRDQLWQALDSLSHHAGTAALPGMSACQVLSDDGRVVARDAVVYGELVHETITLAQPVTAHLERSYPGGCTLTMTEIIHDGPGGLLFSCMCMTCDAGDGSAAAKTDGLCDFAQVVCENTLARARELVA